MSCLDNIVSVKDFCNPNAIENIGSSGYDIMNAPEISLKRVSAIVTDEHTQVRKFILDVVKQATNDIKNDFLGALSLNYRTDLSQQSYESSIFKSDELPTSNAERGFTFYKANYSSRSLKTAVIEKVYINALEVKDNVEFYIYDGDLKTTFVVNVKKLGINPFPINYKVRSSSARIVMKGNALKVASTRLICFVGCNNTLPNDCGNTKSFNDGHTSNKEGYGLGIKFSCLCDYDKMLCDLSNSFVGKLVYLKTRIMLLEYAKHSDRFNNVVIFGSTEKDQLISQLTSEYNQCWNTLVSSLPNTLKAYKGDCVECKGIQIKVNV